MRVKTFRGKDTTSVLAQIKAELGSDAVILSTQNNTTEDGQPICEIMVGMEAESISIPAPKKEKSKYDSEKQAGPIFAPFAGRSGMGGDWQKEWDLIKDHILALLKGRMDMTALTPRQRLAMQFLEREGVNDDVLLSIFRALRDDPQTSVLEVLSGIVPVKPFVDSAWPDKFHALAGPYGVGKTSIALRLALSFKRARPKSRLAILLAGGEALKGRMVLRHWCELSGISYREAASPEEMAMLVAESAAFDKIFLDLPGMGVEDDLAPWIQEKGLYLCPKLKVHLILCPHYAERQMQVFYAKYATEYLASVIWSKVDEACLFGGIINFSKAASLPVSALSFGAGLKNTLVPASSGTLWKLVFKHELPGI